MEQTKLAYAAGILDGEGSILLSKERAASRFRYPRVTVASTSIEILEAMYNLFGGCICTHKTYQKHHKKNWSWRADNTAAIEVLKLLLPYLRVPEKIYRATLIVTEYHQVTPRNGKYDDYLLDQKEQFEKRFFHPSGA